MIWVLIGLMALVTFYNRYAFFSPNLKLSIGARTRSMLKYTAPAVLTALWVPIVFVKNTQLNTDLTDPYLVAGLLTVVLSLVIKHPLVIVAVGLLIFSVLRFVL